MMAACCHQFDARAKAYKRLFRKPSHEGLMACKELTLDLGPNDELCDDCWYDVIGRRRIISWLIDAHEHPRERN